MRLEKYSFGTGDRFGRQGIAQLQAILEMNRLGVPVVPVWNKSNREHLLIGSQPDDLEAEARQAAASCDYRGKYHVDADHINLSTVERFTRSHDFYTIDVAAFIGGEPASQQLREFLEKAGPYTGVLQIPGIEKTFDVTPAFLRQFAGRYLCALEEVKKVYDYLCRVRGRENFITEVSVDESDTVQSPLELFFILLVLQSYHVDVQTLAPRFSGLFAKGIDYIGDVRLFAIEFNQDLAVIRYVKDHLGVAENLKLSVHSGSDKFSIYPSIRKGIAGHDAGIHVKTAGTTWLEEVAGLAESGADGLSMVKDIYAASLNRFEELAAPYMQVLHIDRKRLPAWAEVRLWDSRQFSETVTHNPQSEAYNPHFRQLMHIGYKVAAESGSSFTDLLEKHAGLIGEKVRFNLLERHLKLLFCE